MKVVIMAGGKGTRISSIAKDIPKPMIPILNKPVLEHQINFLKEQGFNDLIITIGYLGNVIKQYFGDGSKFGVKIDYYFEDHPLGNAGALFKLKDKLVEDFLLINGDSIFNIDVNRFVKYHNSKRCLATILTHPNSHPFDSGLIVCDSNGSVINWYSKEDKRPTWYKNRVNAGIHIISHKLLEKDIKIEVVDLDRDILKPLCGSQMLFAYDSPEYVKDMGTPERLLAVINDFKNGIIFKKSLLNKQKAIFLDRDGTINKYVGFLTDIHKFELIDGVADAIKKINNSGYLAIVITNQPAIARGELSFDGLNEIHNKMETLLGEQGAYLDAIYFCPHHPDKGFPGEIKELKIDCECRKPKPGMLIKAAKHYNIELSNSWMIGDTNIDIKTAFAAGCKAILIGENESANIKKVRNLSKAVDYILKKHE